MRFNGLMNLRFIYLAVVVVVAATKSTKYKSKKTEKKEISTEVSASIRLILATGLN